MYFSTNIFGKAGLTGDWPKYATLAMGTINVLMTIVSVFLVDHPKFGRRTLHLASLAGMIVCSIALVIMLTLLVSVRSFAPRASRVRQSCVTSVRSGVRTQVALVPGRLLHPGIRRLVRHRSR